jgi:hypothetical protein
VGLRPAALNLITAAAMGGNNRMDLLATNHLGRAL